LHGQVGGSQQGSAGPCLLLPVWARRLNVLVLEEANVEMSSDCGGLGRSAEPV